jgi:hypothetical protein
MINFLFITTAHDDFSIFFAIFAASFCVNRHFFLQINCADRFYLIYRSNQPVNLPAIDSAAKCRRVIFAARANKRGGSIVFYRFYLISLGYVALPTGGSSIS